MQYPISSAGLGPRPSFPPLHYGDQRSVAVGGYIFVLRLFMTAASFEPCSRVDYKVFALVAGQHALKTQSDFRKKHHTFEAGFRGC